MAKYNITEKKDKKAAYRSLLNPRKMDELEAAIKNIVVDEKSYLDKDFSAVKLAEAIGTNTRYISATINTRFNMNFSEYVNSKRVEDAMTLLTSKQCLKMTMSDVADAVGFANRQSFYAAFFKFQNCTPRDFKMSYLKRHPDLKPKRK